MSESAAFNLIEKPWLPARRRSGVVEQIPPWFITDQIMEDPFVSFAWPRPDFDRAAQEFLIGLLSTAAAPADDHDWEEQWLMPPAPEALKTRFTTVSSGFNLDGQGPRFMQDLDPLDEAKQTKAATLLIDTPGTQTLKRNADLFVKRNTVPVLGRAAAAMALFTLNSYAPSGGAGHRTSLRGGGPLTTLIVADSAEYGATLWGILWPNVETREQCERRATDTTVDDNLHRIFPWMAPTRTSEKAGGRSTTPADVHPLQVYWGMPRRIRLSFEESNGRHCSITNGEDAFVVSSCRTKNYGTDYSAGFTHPLTPYYRQKAGGPLLPVHPTPGGISYRLWPGVVVYTGDDRREPAQVIRHWHQRSAVLQQTRFAAFGYDMDNMKARGWVEGEMPLWYFDSETREGLNHFIRCVVAGAVKVATLTTKAVKSALYDRPSKATGNYQFIAERFYRETESRFFGALEQAANSLREQPEADDATIVIREEWVRMIAAEAMQLFDEYAPLDDSLKRDTLRHVKARYYLGLALRGIGKDGKKLYESDLEIAIPQSTGSR